MKYFCTHFILLQEFGKLCKMRKGLTNSNIFDIPFRKNLNKTNNITNNILLNYSYDVDDMKNGV